MGGGTVRRSWVTRLKRSFRALSSIAAINFGFRTTLRFSFVNKLCFRQPGAYRERLYSPTFPAWINLTKISGPVSAAVSFHCLHPHRPRSFPISQFPHEFKKKLPFLRCLR